MRIYSNEIGWETIQKGLNETGLADEGVVLRAIQNVERANKRKWEHAFDFTLRATVGRDRNGRMRNRPSPLSRQVPIGIEPEYPKVPTYDEWGILINWLYDQEPTARIGNYKNNIHFHKVTQGEFA